MGSVFHRRSRLPTVPFIVAVLLVALVLPIPATAGVDGDGHLDAVFASKNQENRLCFGSGTGFSNCTSISADTNWTLGVALGDVNGDGQLDAVFANQGTENRVCFGGGAGFSGCVNISSDTNLSRGVALGDVNGDGNLDAVFGNNAGTNRVCVGDGLGSFTCSDVSVDINSTLGGVAFGDVNGDGALDAVFANDGANRVCLGDGTGLFSCSDVSGDTDNTRGLTLGDVDGNGDLDAVFANDGQPNRACFGNGNGLFSCVDVSADTNSTIGVALGDVNGDDDLDAVFTNEGQKNRVCLGSGTVLFGGCLDVSTDSNNTIGVALGDVDENGDLDAVFANNGQVDRVCLGSGAGLFSCSDVSADTFQSFGVALTPVGTDRVGLVEPNGRWHLRRSDGSEYTFFYGVPGDVPLLGDWNGDGFDTPGMYRPANGFAYLTNTLPPDGGVGVGDPALTFFYGIPGDQVFVGDWDGDGTDTLGISRNGKMFLANSNATVPADLEFWFGVPTDTAFGGDPDGDGRDSVILYRASSGFTYLTNLTPMGPDDIAPTDGNLFFGVPTDRFVIGDWNDDETDTVGIFRPGNTSVFLRNVNTTGPANVSYSFGQSAWTPVAGSWY